MRLVAVRREQQRGDLRAHHHPDVPGPLLQPDHHAQPPGTHQSKRGGGEDVLLQLHRANRVLGGHPPLRVHGVRPPLCGRGSAAPLQVLLPESQNGLRGTDEQIWRFMAERAAL